MVLLGNALSAAFYAPRKHYDTRPDFTKNSFDFSLSRSRSKNELRVDKEAEELRALHKVALEEGVVRNDEEKVKKALAAGAALLVDRDKLTELCAQEGHFSMVKILLSSPDFTSSSLDTKSKKGIWGDENGSHISQEPIYPFKQNIPLPHTGETALHYAVRTEDRDFVKLLLKNKASLEVTDNLKRTPLHNAVVGPFPAIAQILLAAGARVDSKEHFAKTPTALLLMENCDRCSGKCEEILKMLIASGCDLRQFKDILVGLVKDENSVLQVIIDCA